ncbi:hypothetical protein [Bradyrhizobium sp. 17]|nr:hypothetical protein [Bradyrhizobium sp. 17]
MVQQTDLRDRCVIAFNGLEELSAIRQLPVGITFRSRTGFGN